MGSFFSKSNSTPELSETESWSTLRDFVTSESERNRQEAGAITDKKLQEQKSSFQLEVHINKSVHRNKTQMNFNDSLSSLQPVSRSIPKGTLEENRVEPLKVKFERHLSKPMFQKSREQSMAISGQSPVIVRRRPNERQMSMSRNVMLKHTPSSLGTFRQPSQIHLERQMTQSKYIASNDSPLVMKDSDTLKIGLDASRNLCHEPTDQQIKRQIQHWKTEFFQSKGEGGSTPTPATNRKILQPKHSKSFYGLRKALVNREKILLEHGNYMVKSISPTIQEEELLAKHSTKEGSVQPRKSLIQKEDKVVIPEEVIKTYDKETSFEFKINKDLPPGFNMSTGMSESEKVCKSLVEKIQVKESEMDFRKTIDELFKSWKISGFLRDIEDYALNFSANTTDSVDEISQHITPSNARYLISLSDQVHIQVAKAYAIYCWISNNITSNERNNFKPTSLDYSTLFVRIADHAGLKAEVINGKVRTWRSLSDDLDSTTPHSWNTVKIGDVQLQLDCTLGSGYINSSIGCFTHDYFATPPQDLIFTHWPNDVVNQFLESSLSLEELQLIIPVPMTTFRQKVFPLTWSESLYVPSESQYPVVSVNVNTNDNSCVLSANLIAGPEINLPIDSLDQNVFLNRVNNLWNIQATVPLKGKYQLNVFLRAHHSDDSCLSYIIHCDAESELKVGYPKLHEAALTMYDLNLIHWNNPAQSYVCQNLSGLLNMVFEAVPNLNFDHYILPGRVTDPNTFPAGNIKRYNTTLFSNTGVDVSLYQLQAVFPSNGWWTVNLYGAMPSKNKYQSWNYASLLTYYLYVAVGLPRNSYPHILAPHIVFNSLKPITTSEEEQLSVQFASSKYLNFRHYITIDQPTGMPLENFSKIDFNGKIKKKDCYIYSLKVIFPLPGDWYIHIFGRERDKNQESFTSLFKLNTVVCDAMKNTTFVDYNSTIGDIIGIHILNSGLFVFSDDGQPLCYRFEALPDVKFLHSLKSQENDDPTHDYCTYLSSESIDEPDSSRAKYMLHAIFPSAGKWLVQVFAAEKKFTNYSLVFSLNVSVTDPNPHLCYPKISPVFRQFNMNINSEQALLKKNCENGEFELPFKAPTNAYFTWSMELLETGEKLLSNAFIDYNYETGDETNNRLFHVIFPKPGEWLIRLFSKQSINSSNKAANSRLLLELHLNSLSYKGKISFPQIFEPFYTPFNLQLNKKHLPLVSEVQEIPTEVVIPLYSPPDVQFWHDIDVKYAEESNASFSHEDQCKMMSDPSTGQHQIIIEVNAKGKWTVSLFAKKFATAEKTWTPVLKHIINSI